MYIDSDKESDDKYPKFEVSDHVAISKFRNIFAKGYTQNLSEKVFVIKKVKYTAPWANVINDLNGEEIVGMFYKNELQRTNQEKFRMEKVINNKLPKSWIDKKDVIECNSTV